MNFLELKIRKNTTRCERQIEFPCNSEIKYLMCTMFTSTRGGVNRIKIISKLIEISLNSHRLSIELGMAYKVVQHHLRVLEKNNLIESSDNRYGKLYSVSPLLMSNNDVFEEISLKMKHYF